MQDRIDFLKSLAGMEVRHRREKGESVYEFYEQGRNVKTCFTYDKARLFAEGVQYGIAVMKAELQKLLKEHGIPE